MLIDMLPMTRRQVINAKTDFRELAEQLARRLERAEKRHEEEREELELHRGLLQEVRAVVR